MKRLTETSHPCPPLLPLLMLPKFLRVYYSKCSLTFLPRPLGVLNPALRIIYSWEISAWAGSPPPVLCHISSQTLSFTHLLPRSLLLNSVPVSKFCIEQRFPWNPPQLLSGLLSWACLFTENDHSTTKFPVHQIKSGETHCFDSPLKSILINYSVLKYCSGLINLIKSLHWTAIRAWIHLHEFNIPYTSSGIFCSEENIALQQKEEQYHLISAAVWWCWFSPWLLWCYCCV